MRPLRQARFCFLLPLLAAAAVASARRAADGAVEFTIDGQATGSGVVALTGAWQTVCYALPAPPPPGARVCFGARSAARNLTAGCAADQAACVPARFASPAAPTARFFAEVEGAAGAPPPEVGVLYFNCKLDLKPNGNATHAALSIGWTWPLGARVAGDFVRLHDVAGNPVNGTAAVVTPAAGGGAPPTAGALRFWLPLRAPTGGPYTVRLYRAARPLEAVVSTGMSATAADWVRLGL